MKLIPIGFGSYVSAGRIVTVMVPESNPVKRIISQAREEGCLLDATYGRKTETVLVMDSGHVILSATTPDELAAKIGQGGSNEQ